MEKDFSKHQLKPGDEGFEYDKRITFEKDNTEPLEDDSWGADSDDEEIASAKNNNNLKVEEQQQNE